jgi:hypothetical protein
LSYINLLYLKLINSVNTLLIKEIEKYDLNEKQNIQHKAKTPVENLEIN